MNGCDDVTAKTKGISQSMSSEEGNVEEVSKVIEIVGCDVKKKELDSKKVENVALSEFKQNADSGIAKLEYINKFCLKSEFEGIWMPENEREDKHPKRMGLPNESMDQNYEDLPSSFLKPSSHLIDANNNETITEIVGSWYAYISLESNPSSIFSGLDNLNSISNEALLRNSKLSTVEEQNKTSVSEDISRYGNIFRHSKVPAVHLLEGNDLVRARERALLVQGKAQYLMHNQEM